MARDGTMKLGLGSWRQQPVQAQTHVQPERQLPGHLVQNEANQELFP